MAVSSYQGKEVQMLNPDPILLMLGTQLLEVVLDTFQRVQVRDHPG